MPLSAQELNRTFSWNKQVGSTGSYGAYVNAQLRVYNASHSEVAASAQGTAGGSLIGFTQELLNLQSNASASVARGAHADVSVKVLGQSVFQNNWDANTLTITKTPFTKTFDKAYNGQVVIAAIPIAYVVGVTGTAGVEFNFTLKAGPSATVVVTPSVSATTYARLGVGIGCCLTAGIGANLTIITEKIPMSAGVNLSPDPARVIPSWGVRFWANVTSDMNLLKGNIYAFLKIKIWPIKKTFKADLFSWSGFDIRTTLFDTSAWVSVNEPFPQLVSMNPSSVLVGTSSFGLAVKGSGFGSTSSVLWNGSPLTITSFTSTQLNVTVPASLRNFSTATTAAIQVQNGGAFPGSSSVVTFPIRAPLPSLRSVSPGGATAGGGPVTLTMNGVNLLPGTQIYWNSTPLTTSYISDLQISANVPATLTDNPGTAQVTALLADVLRSNPISFTVYDTNPLVSTLSPATAWPGSTDITVTVSGTGYLPASVVYYSGAPLQTTYVDGVTLRAVVPATLMVNPRIEKIGVITAGHTPSNVASFAVANRTFTAYEVPAPAACVNATASGVNNNGTVSGFCSYPGLNSINGFVSSPRSNTFTYIGNGVGNKSALPEGGYSTYGDSAIAALQPNADAAVGMNTTAGNTRGVQGQYFTVSGGASYSTAFAWISGINASGIAVGGDNSNSYITTIGQPNGPTAGVGTNPRGIGGSLKLAAHPSHRSLTGARTVGLRPLAINDNNDVLDAFGLIYVGGIGNYIQLPTNGAAGNINYVNSMNNSRTAVGVTGPYSETIYALSGMSAAMWPNGGSRVPLDFQGGVPLHINDAGDIVGEDGNFDGVLYSGGALRNLNTLLSNTVNGTVGSAVDIAPNGNIAALLYRNNNTVGTLLLVPDPPPTSLLAATDAFSMAGDAFQANASSLVTASVALSQTASSAQNGLARVPQGTPQRPHILRQNVLSGLGLLDIAPASVVAGTTGLQITVTGTAFEQGGLVYWNSSPLTTTYTNSTTMTAAVPDALIATASSATVAVVNPGGDTSGAVVFNVNNPTPAPTSISPVQISAGSTGRTLTVNGTGFVPRSAVYWSGTALATAYVSAFQVTVAIPDGLLALPGTAAITVVNPDPGSSSSEPIVLGISAPTPTLTGLSSTSATAGASGLVISLAGGGFDPTSVVLWDNSPLVTTYVSPSSLTAAVPASSLSVAGTSSVKVTDTIEDSGNSQSISFNINNPSPQVSSITPTSLAEGSTAYTLTVTGSGFVNGSTIYIEGTAMSTTYISATQVTAILSASDILLVSGTPTAQVSVQNPEPAAVPQSNSVALTILTAPAIQSLAPAMARQNSSVSLLTVTGSGFTAQSIVVLGGSALSTSYVSATQLTAVIPNSSLTAAGNFAVTVNGGSLSDPSAAVSDPVAFTVSATAPATPTIAGITPVSTVAGSGDQFITINGTGFNSATVGLWNGTTVLSTAFVTPTQVMLLVPAANVLTPGTVNIQMQNPADNLNAGGGTSNTVKFNVLSSAGSSVQIVPANAVVGRNFLGDIILLVNLNNNGTGAATNVVLNTAKIGASPAFEVPISVGNIAPGSYAQVFLTIPGSAGLSGAPATLSFTGTYLGGTFTSSARVTLQ